MHHSLHQADHLAFCLLQMSFQNFEKSAWGQKLSARVSKDTTTDFQRYQWAKAKVKRSRAVTAELKKLSGRG